MEEEVLIKYLVFYLSVFLFHCYISFKENYQFSSKEFIEISKMISYFLTLFHLFFKSASKSAIENQMKWVFSPSVIVLKASITDI